jgi:transcriptional regulator with XRE-family HTH domain
MEEGKNVGKMINKLRKNSNMTQQELADKLNIKHQTIQKYEKGIIINIPIPTLKQIAAIFNISLYELLDPDITFDFSDNKRKEYLRNILLHFFEEITISNEDKEELLSFCQKAYFKFLKNSNI